MASEIGIIKTLIGTAVATASDGSQRTLKAGDSVFQDEVITTGAAGAIAIELADGSLMTLGRDSQAVLDTNVYDPSAVSQVAVSVDSDLDAIQQTILDGTDPTQVGEATAAGAGTQTIGNEGHQPVSVDYHGSEMQLGVTSGFDSTGVTNTISAGVDETVFDFEPTAGITTVLLDEDNLTTKEDLSVAFLVLQGAFQLSSGLTATRAAVNGINDQGEGDDLAPNALTLLSGTLAADFGGNGAGDIVFNAGNTQPAGITSGGEALQYWVSEDGYTLIGYTESNGVAEIILTAQITDAEVGAFQVALYGSVDHADGSTEDNLSIDFGFTVSDSDGDTAEGTLRFDIDDDAPVTGETIASVDEDYLGEDYFLGYGDDIHESSPQALAIVAPFYPSEFSSFIELKVVTPFNYYQGNGDEAKGDNLGQEAPSTVSGTINVDFGADGPGGIVFNEEGQTEGLTSQGADIQYWVSEDGQSLVAYALREIEFDGKVKGGPLPVLAEGGSFPVFEFEQSNSLSPQYAEVVFTAAVVDKETGEYRVTLYSRVDQPDATTKDNVQINLAYSATDFDGDSAQGILTVDVDDDSPVISYFRPMSENSEQFETDELSGLLYQGRGDQQLVTDEDDLENSDGYNANGLVTVENTSVQYINGTGGNDLLIGGTGDDILSGGAGSDIFVWNAEDLGVSGAPAHDIVVDFDHINEDDVLDLTDLLADSSHTIEGIDNSSGYLQLNIINTDNNIVQEIELLGVHTFGAPGTALRFLELDNAIDGL